MTTRWVSSSPSTRHTDIQSIKHLHVQLINFYTTMTIRRALPAVKKQTTAAFLAALADGDVKTAQVSFSQSNFIRASYYIVVR